MLPPDVKHMIQRVEYASQQMETNLQRLLLYAQLRHEHPDLGRVETEQIALQVLAERCRETVPRQTEIVVVRPLPPVCACPRLLAKALDGLLAVMVERRAPAPPTRITISCVEQDHSVLVNVADECVSDQTCYQKAILEPIECVSRYVGCKGTDLALAIVRRAIERMSGRLWTKPGRGRGSCFQMTLPRA